jgi:hypothetical protein
VAWDTAGNVLTDAAVELGLPSVADPYLSADPNQVQLRTLLKSLGRELWRERAWTHLVKEHSFTTVAGDYQYPLPADFGYLVNQTGWNRTTRLPLGGPLSAQTWHYALGFGVSLSLTVQFRPMAGELRLYPTTALPGDQVIAFEYVSSYWAASQGQSAPDKAAPTASSDTLYFDPLLLTRGLKLAFLKTKGFDTTAALDDYVRTLAAVMGDDSAAPVLHLDKRARGEPLLGYQNVPETGHGS